MFIDPAVLTNSHHNSELLEHTQWSVASDAEVKFHIRNAERMRSEAFRSAVTNTNKWVKRSMRQLFSAPSYVRHA